MKEPYGIHVNADDGAARWKIGRNGKTILFIQTAMNEKVLGNQELILGLYPGDPPNPRYLCSAVLRARIRQKNIETIEIDNFTLFSNPPRQIRSMDDFTCTLDAILAAHWESAAKCR